jgi:hydrogenase maturation protease
LSKKIAVIGIGNTLRRDDGIGIIVLESLLKFYKREGIDYLNFGIATFDLLHRIRNYDTVLLIDGVRTNLPVGELKIFELGNIKYNTDNLATSTHELNLEDVFKLSKKIALKTKIYVAGIQIGDLSYNEGLSDILKNKQEEIIRQINLFIDKIF